MKVIIIAVLVALASAAEFNKELDSVWTHFQSKFMKVYDSDEEVFRRAIFENNVEYIKKHNMEADLGLHSFTLGLNKLADWTNEERRALLGTRVGSEQQQEETSTLPMNVNANPSSVDWRNSGYVTSVKDQGSCGSCWAFSATGGLEGQMYAKNKQLQSYSEQQLVDCSSSYGNQGCNGGWMSYAWNYVKDLTNKNEFLDIQSCYTYTGKDGSCKASTATSCKGATCKSFTQLKAGNESALETALASVGPVSVAIDASHNSFSYYKSGVYDESACTTTVNHGVLAVGYGTTSSNQEYYIVKNSWGTSWGISGYIWMSRNKNNQCNIAGYSMYPNV